MVGTDERWRCQLSGCSLVHCRVRLSSSREVDVSDTMPLLRLPQKTSPLPSTLTYTSPTSYRVPGVAPVHSGALPGTVVDPISTMETLVAPSTVQPLRI